MNNRGSLFFLLSLIFLAVILVLLASAVYFYNFHVFKTFRVCISEESNDLPLSCDNDFQCLDFFMGGDVDSFLSEFPDFLSVGINEVLSKSLYCDGICKLREVRGFNPSTKDIEELDSCESFEEEVKIEIRGKEALALYDYYKQKS